MAISMLKIRRPLGRLIFNMGIAIPGKTVFLIETAPRVICFIDVLLVCCMYDTLRCSVINIDEWMMNVECSWLNVDG